MSEFRRSLMAQNKYIETEGVLPLSVASSKDSVAKDYRVYGCDTQTIDGEVMGAGDRTKNLVDFNSITPVKSKLTSYSFQNGTYTFEATSYNAGLQFNISTFFVPVIGKTYILSYEVIKGNDLSLRIYNSTKSKYIGTQNTLYTELTITNDNYSEGDVIRVYVYKSNSYYQESAFRNLQITESSDYSYEPYGYKIPLVNESHNLWDEETVFGYYKDDGTLVSNPSYSASKNKLYLYCENIYIKSQKRLWFLFFDSSGNNIGNTGWVKNKIVELPNGISYAVFYSHPTDGVIEDHDICINESDASFNGQYEPYHEPITTNIFLTKPLMKIGDVADYVDYKRGVVVRRIGSVDMGTLSWNRYNDVSDRYIWNAQLAGAKAGNAKAFSDIYEWRNWSSLNTLGDGKMQFHPSLARLYLCDNSYTDAASFKTAMSGVILYYELAEPVEEAISLPQLPIYKGNVIDAECTIKPSKVYIKSKK